MVDKIRRLLKYYMRIYSTNDPFLLAKYLNIEILYVPLDDIAGYYKCLKRRKYIFLNSEICDEIFLRVVAAHELGHALLHPKENCAFMQGHTLLLTSRIEMQANMFAAELLITDALIEEYADYSIYQFDEHTGIPEELIKLRMRNLYGDFN